MKAIILDVKPKSFVGAENKTIEGLNVVVLDENTFVRNYFFTHDKAKAVGLTEDMVSDLFSGQKPKVVDAEIAIGYGGKAKINKLTA